MEFLNYTQFRNQSKKYFDEVQKGRSFAIIRKGQPVAEISPFESDKPRWRSNIKRIALKPGAPSLDQVIRQERDQ